MVKNKEIKSTVGSWILIVISFLLGIYDMINLSDSLGSMTKFSSWELSFVTLLIATIANFCAFLWGKGNGEELEKKKLNKKTISGFLGWFAIGLVYLAIRIASLSTHISGGESMDIILGDVFMMVLLLVMYIGTGLTISTEARKIFDADIVGYKNSKKEFEKIHEEVTEEMSSINEHIGIIENYRENYKNLDVQYEKIKKSIYHAEEAAMAEIVGKMIEANPKISPTSAHRVMDDFLENRSIEDETKKIN